MPAILDHLKEIVQPKKHDEPHVVADSARSTAQPKFDSNKVTVIFVLGGPGAGRPPFQTIRLSQVLTPSTGKGTQSEKLVQEYDFCHLSGTRAPPRLLTTIRGNRWPVTPYIAGDLLRAEQNREGSQYGELIRTYIREGTIVPMEVTIKLLENAMADALASRAAASSSSSSAAPTSPGWAGGKGRFLVDGFPRKMDQALKFEEDVCRAALVLFYTTTEQVMLDRLLERGKTSGREDDNEESIVKRFRECEIYVSLCDAASERQRQGRTRRRRCPWSISSTRRAVWRRWAACCLAGISPNIVPQIDASPSVEEVYAKTKVVIDMVFAGEVRRNLTVWPGNEYKTSIG
jgi:UMP-CMP kinase